MYDTEAQRRPEKGEKRVNFTEKRLNENEFDLGFSVERQVCTKLVITGNNS